MQTIKIQDMCNHVGQTVTIKGWLYHSRAGGKVLEALRGG